MKFPDYYPPSPKKVPEDLTEVSPPFRRHVNLMAVSLLVFFVLYFGLIALLAVGILYCLLSGNAGLWLVAVLLLVPLGILVKNLFNKQKIRKGREIEIELADHPKLEKFLECVCEETGAPMPDRVLLNFEVNASAGNEVSLGCLFREPTRILTLGFGLLNVLNLTEFKALLAHEFGHLSQMDMKSAPYVRLAMQVITNILCGTKVVGLDKVMEAIFIFVVKLNYGLSREMEFHADLVAVSVAGSDAVPHMLYKCYWAEATLQRAAADLQAAVDHGLYSRDVFLHQTQAGKYLRKQTKNNSLGLPPKLPSDRKRTLQLFRDDHEEDQVARMWASHPPNHEREINAKAHYIRTEFDESSPWILFNNRDELREEVSYQFYREVFRVKKKDVQWSSGAKVKEFLDDEYAETIFDVDCYGYMYNNRNIEHLDLRELRDHSEQNPNTPEELLASHLTMFTPAVKKFAQVFQRHYEEMQLLEAIQNRWYVPKNKRFEMRGQKLHSREVKGLMKDIKKEMKADSEWLGEFDTRVFVTYYEIARHLDKKSAAELFERYQFHFVIQTMWSMLQPHKAAMNYMFEQLSQIESGVLDDDSFHMMIEVFRQAYDALKEVVVAAEEVSFPELANMPAGEPVRPFLLKDSLLDRPSHFDLRIKKKWFKKFTNQFNGVEQRLSRLQFKSLGNILSLQEALGAKAEKAWSIPVAQFVEQE